MHSFSVWLGSEVPEGNEAAFLWKQITLTILKGLNLSFCQTLLDGEEFFCVYLKKSSIFNFFSIPEIVTTEFPYMRLKALLLPHKYSATFASVASRHLFC